MSEEKQTEDLTQRILDAAKTGEAVDDVLKTDERVLARITDGIYRQPASALRELIANAYDADAKSVVIDCDPPRFNKITIRDDGSGMSIETLAHVLHHIGGSLKRTDRGAELSVASRTDVQVSPGGRKLIGRIGIGLFSVVQLTPHFQIITKTKGASHRIVADIIMAAETIEQATHKHPDRKELTTGHVRIWTEPATDSESHGTDIILLDIRPQTKEMLRSKARWQALQKDPDILPPDWLPTAASVPTFHIGGLSFENDSVIETSASLPWNSDDNPETKFAKLVEGVRSQAKSVASPEIKDSLDNYFQMLWTLSLGLPARYVDTHPFDVKPDHLDIYVLSNERRGQPKSIETSKGKTARSQLGLTCPEGFEDDHFQIVIDGVSISRPIEIKRAEIRTSTAIEKDLVFFGTCTPDLSSVAEEFRGGPLSFEAYIYWSPKVVPKDHNGVLVRIKGASGTLFDRTFLGYQVAENTRLKQLTAEIYVKEGLEGALNIDRESFNYANIHYQFLSRWLHGAIRQVANRHKAISKESNQNRKDVRQAGFTENLSEISKEIWLKQTNNEDELPPQMEVVDNANDTAPRADEIVVSRNLMYAFVPPSEKSKYSKELESRVAAIYQVLHAYGLLEGMAYERQLSLISDIAHVLYVEAKDGV